MIVTKSKAAEIEIRRGGNKTGVVGGREAGGVCRGQDCSQERHSPKEMLRKVGALHPGYRSQGYSIADIPNSPDAGHTTLAEVIHLDTSLFIQIHPNLHNTGVVISQCLPTYRGVSSAGKQRQLWWQILLVI